MATYFATYESETCPTGLTYPTGLKARIAVQVARELEGKKLFVMQETVLPNGSIRKTFIG